MDNIKKWVLGYLVLVVSILVGILLIPTTGIEAKRFWMVDGLLGDGTSGQSRYLDQIDSTAGVSNLANGDYAVYLSGTSELMVFVYNSSVTGSNHTSSGVSRPFTVVPYDDPANGLWGECFPTMVSGYVAAGTTLFFGTGVTAPSIFAVDNSYGVSAYLTDQNGNSVDFGDLISKN